MCVQEWSHHTSVLHVFTALGTHLMFRLKSTEEALLSTSVSIILLSNRPKTFRKDPRG